MILVTSALAWVMHTLLRARSLNYTALRCRATRMVVFPPANRDEHLPMEAVEITSQHWSWTFHSILPALSPSAFDNLCMSARAQSTRRFLPRTAHHSPCDRAPGISNLITYLLSSCLHFDERCFRGLSRMSHSRFFQCVSVSKTIHQGSPKSRIHLHELPPSLPNDFGTLSQTSHSAHVSHPMVLNTEVEFLHSVSL